MLSLDELEKIRPGDVITYEERFLCETLITTEKVIEVACRCGFDKNGHLVEGYDDYVITDSECEVSYKDIINIEKGIL